MLKTKGEKVRRTDFPSRDLSVILSVVGESVDDETEDSRKGSVHGVVSERSGRHFLSLVPGGLERRKQIERSADG